MRIGLGLAIVVGATAPSSAGPHPGRVVRVERAARQRNGVPRMCIMSGTSAGVCLGPQPKIGDAIRLIGPTHLIGELRITSIRSVSMCRDDPSLAWQVTADADGTLDPDGPSGDALGVLDVPIDPRGHIVDAVPTPGDGQTGLPARAIDADGDGTLDLQFTVQSCDDAGTARALCIDVWTASGASLQRLRRDTMPEGC